MASEQSSAGVAYKRRQLFILSCIALTTAAMVFSIRATVMEDLGIEFALDAKTVGWAVGWAFLAFAISVFIGSPLCDYAGMRFLLSLAGVLHIGGTLITIYTAALGNPALVLSIGMFTVGLAHGLVEAVINPLIAALFVEDKTHKLNVLHAWWPGGIVIGGLIGLGMRELDLGWQARLAVILIPSAVYLVLCLSTRFPPTERKAAGVSGAEMIREAFRPLFIVIFLCMFLTAATELGPGQWVDAMLKTVGFPGILVLVYISALMFVLRQFVAGITTRLLTPIALMWVSSLLAGIGLLLLSAAKSPPLAIVAATVWGAGVCYMWPTMLGISNERFPKGGALLMGLMGTAGNLSTYLVLPLMGKVYDSYTQKFLAPGQVLQDLLNRAATDPTARAALDAARTDATPYAFRYVAALAVVLIIVFGIIWIRDKVLFGGYKAVKLADVLGGAEGGAAPEAPKAEE